MIAAVKLGAWNTVGDEMVDSRWYNQIGNRGKELVAQMRNNRFQD